MPHAPGLAVGSQVLLFGDVVKGHAHRVVRTLVHLHLPVVAPSDQNQVPHGGDAPGWGKGGTRDWG